MVPVSEGFRDALTSGGDLRSIARVVVLLDGEEVCELPVDSGTVTMDGKADIARSFSAVVTESASITLNEVYDAIANAGAEVQIWRGLAIDGTDELISLGVFGLVEADLDEDLGRIALTGEDRAGRVMGNKWIDPYQVGAAATLGPTVAAILRDRYPQVIIGFDEADYAQSVPRAVLTSDRGDPWKDVRDMVAAHGFDLHFDGDGVAQIGVIRDPSDTVPDIDYPLGSVVIARPRRIVFNEVYNGVVASGEGSWVGAPVRAVVWDDDPRSPTYAYGHMGKRPFVYTSPHILTATQAANAARSKLALMKGLCSRATWTMVPNPSHEPFDVVSHDGNVYMIDALTVPLLPTEAMTATMRENRTEAR